MEAKAKKAATAVKTGIKKKVLKKRFTVTFHRCGGARRAARCWRLRRRRLAAALEAAPAPALRPHAPRAPAHTPPGVASPRWGCRVRRLLRTLRRRPAQRRRRMLATAVPLTSSAQATHANPAAGPEVPAARGAPAAGAGRLPGAHGLTPTTRRCCACSRSSPAAWPTKAPPPAPAHSRPPALHPPLPKVIKFPLTTESAMKKIEDNNTLVFIGAPPPRLRSLSPPSSPRVRPFPLPPVQWTCARTSARSGTL